MIAHIVLFNPKPELGADNLRAFAHAIHAASAGIPSVQRASVGPWRDVTAAYASIFGQTNYRFAAILEFDDEEGLKSYLAHPLHIDLGRMFWESCDSTVISDVELRDAKSPEVIQFLLNDQ